MKSPKKEYCDLFKQIPREKLKLLFENSPAGTELDCFFLAFEDAYRYALTLIPKDKVVIDMGCAYATQSWYFREHAKYIGVDTCLFDGYKPEDCVLHTENSEYCFTTIQDFIENVWPDLQREGLGQKDVFAICSAVPDRPARELVLDIFDNCIDWYPGEMVTVKQNGIVSKYDSKNVLKDIGSQSH